MENACYMMRVAHIAREMLRSLGSPPGIYLIGG